MNEVTNYREEDLQRIKSAWMENIKKAKDGKKDFEETAAQLTKYYAKSHSELVYGGDDEDSTVSLWARATINKTFEAVKIFGPALYEQNPVRLVNSENADDPFPAVLGKYLNYVSRELDRRRHARMSIDEALIKGAGLGWTEMDQHTQLAYTAYRSVDDLLLDPDARGVEDIWWLALRCREPLWAFQRKYNAPDVKTSHSDGTSSAGDEKAEGEAKSQDYIVYWKIYSKLGDGLRIKARDDGETKPDDGLQDRRKDYRYIIIAPDHDKPVFIGDWPTPFWADTLSMGWPCAVVDFAREPNKVWPLSILKAGLPLQKWIDWAYSFLLRKVRSTCRDIVALPERLNDKQKATVRNEAQLDLEIMYVNDQQLEDIRKIFTVLQFPAMNGDLLKAIEMAELQFQKVTGLYEVLYGQTPQAYRSAQEAIVKDRNSRLRIDDMGREVVMWENINSRHEAICARFHVKPEQILQMFGQEAAQAWGEYRPGDLVRITREYQYSIETGSLKPLGPNEMVEQTNLALQTLAPMYAQAAAWGPLNRLIADWAKYRQIPKPEELLIPLAPMNGQMVTPAQQQAAEAQAAQAAEAERQAMAQATHDKAVQEGLADAQTLAELKMAQEANAVKMGLGRLKAQTDLTKANIQAQVALRKPKPTGAKK